MDDVRTFHRQGLSISEIHRLTGFDRKTIRKYLLHPERPRYGPRSPRPSKLEPYKPYVAERLQAGVWNARVLLRELRTRGYAGGYTILTDDLRPHRQAAWAVAVRRFETAPGQQAQVDWGLLGTLEQEAHHQGIPLGPVGRPSRTMVHIRLGAPTVEVRPLTVYDTMVGDERP